MANLNFFRTTSSTTFTQCVPESTEFGEMTQNKGHYVVQGPTRSPILVHIESSNTTSYLWSPYVIRQTIIFLPCDFYLSFLLPSFFSSPNLSGRRLDVYHTYTHGVALVRI